MLRVLIADDEERICQLILALGEWRRLNLEVAGVVHNGREALEMVKALAPDILITDIRMPGLDGLELISRAKALAPRLEVIIISGYAQFDYAQTAISSGVSEYLLKPINREQLNRTLEKMTASLVAQKQKESDLERMRLSTLDDRERLRQKMLSDLWLNRQEIGNAERLGTVYHFGAGLDAYQPLLVRVDCEPASANDSSMAVVCRKARDLLAPILAGCCGDAVMGAFDNTVAAVMNLSHETLPSLRSRLRGALNQLVAQKGLYGAVDFSMALGTPCPSPEGLLPALTNARDMLAERLIEGTGRLLEGEPSQSGVLETDVQARYAQMVTHAIDVLSAEEANAAADVLGQAATYPGARGWELLELVRRAGRLFLSRLGGENAEEDMRAFDREIERCGSLALLLQTLKRMQEEQLNAAAARRRDRDAQPIRKAKLYIRKHFADPLTLEEVSEAVGFSVNYFSTLFKKETGEGFLKYLTRARMDEARSLLRDTSCSVAEICGRVGYGDVKHFSKTFKAETGLSPGEYRKLYG